MDDLANRQISALEQKRLKNRLTFPAMASTMDKLAIFSPKVIWAEENGETIGTMPEWAKLEDKWHAE